MTTARGTTPNENVTRAERVSHAERRQQTTEKLREAAMSLLAEHGYNGVTIEAVSQRSGVAKTSIYRRWLSKAQMIFELTFLDANPVFEFAGDTLDESLRSFADRIMLTVTLPTGRAVLPGMLNDMAANENLAASMYFTYIGPNREALQAVLDRAAAAGELPCACGVAHVHATGLGAVYAWTALFRHEMPEDLAEVLTLQLRATLDVVQRRCEHASSAPTGVAAEPVDEPA